jgi:hypothetical protein
LGARARVGYFGNFRWEGVWEGKWEQQHGRLGGRLGGREIFRVLGGKLGGKIFRAFILSFNYLNNVIKICSNVEIGFSSFLKLSHIVQKYSTLNPKQY